MRRVLFLLLSCLTLAPSLALADRPSVTLNPLYINVASRPALSNRTAPRIVRNALSVNYKLYKKGGGTSWGDFPTDTAGITWGANGDGGQWFECASTVTTLERVWAQFGFKAVSGTKYIVSFDVISKTGTFNGYHVALASGTGTGTTSIQNLTVGRHTMVFTSTSTGTTIVKMGIGVLSANANNATIRFGNIMVEQPVPQDRAVPWEYVTPGDERAFAYTYDTTLTGTLVNTPTLGSTYTIPSNSSVLVIGDSWANEEENTPSTWGDFPAHMRRFLRNRPIAVNFRGVAGAQTDEITTQIASSFTETDVSARVSPYTLCIMEGGTNDVAQAKTLAVMQSRRLAQIAAATARGMKIILLTVPPYNAANAGMQTVMDGYNAWIKTLGYPVYDVFTDANDGNSDLKTSWGSGDGVHPGQTYNDGSSIMGQRLADLVLLIGD